MSDADDGPSGLAGRHPRRDRSEAEPGADAAPPPTSDDARGASPGAAHDEASDTTHATPITQQVGRIALVVIAALFVVFALDNAQHVDFSWLVGQTEVVRRGGEHVSGGVPLIILLLVAFVAGAAVGSLVTWQRARHRRRR